MLVYQRVPVLLTEQHYLGSHAYLHCPHSLWIGWEIRLLIRLTRAQLEQLGCIAENISNIPVVPHKAVAEVSKIGNL